MTILMAPSIQRVSLFSLGSGSPTNLLFRKWK